MPNASYTKRCASYKKNRAEIEQLTDSDAEI